MKTVRLSEDAYNKLKERLVNEISYGAVSRADDRSDDLFYNVRSSFEDFFDSVKEAIFKAKYESKEGQETSNPYLNKIMGLCNEISSILDRKKEQQDKFYDETFKKIDHNKFYDSEDGDIDDVDLRSLQRDYPRG